MARVENACCNHEAFRVIPHVIEFSKSEPGKLYIKRREPGSPFRGVIMT